MNLAALLATVVTVATIAAAGASVAGLLVLRRSNVQVAELRRERERLLGLVAELQDAYAKGSDIEVGRLNLELASPPKDVPLIGSIAQSFRVYEIRALGAISRMLPPSLTLIMKPKFGDVQTDGWIHPSETRERGIVVEVYWRVDFTGDRLIQAIRHLIERQYVVLGVFVVVNGTPGRGIDRLTQAINRLNIPISSVSWLASQGQNPLRESLVPLLRKSGLASNLRAPKSTA
jgi:hypothetical protein